MRNTTDLIDKGGMDDIGDLTNKKINIWDDKDSSSKNQTNENNNGDVINNYLNINNDHYNIQNSKNNNYNLENYKKNYYNNNQNINNNGNINYNNNGYYNNSNNKDYFNIEMNPKIDKSDEKFNYNFDNGLQKNGKLQDNISHKSRKIEKMSQRSDTLEGNSNPKIDQDDIIGNDSNKTKSNIGSHHYIKSQTLNNINNSENKKIYLEQNINDIIQNIEKIENL